MGNTPSSQASPARIGGEAGVSPSRTNQQGAVGNHVTQSTAQGAPGSGGGRQPGLRLPMPQRPAHISPQSSNPTSPNGGVGGRGGSPRRRKSLELPDLNKLSFTPAAPVPTLATHTSHHLASTSATSSPQAQTKKIAGTPANQTASPSATRENTSGRWRQALGARVASPLANTDRLGALSKMDPNASVPSPRATQLDGSAGAPVNPYFPSSPPAAAASTSPSRIRNPFSHKPPASGPVAIPPNGVGRSTSLSRPSGSPSKQLNNGTEPPPPSTAPTPPPPSVSEYTTETEGENDGLVKVPIQWNGGGKNVFVTGNFADNWKGRIKLKRSTHDFNTVLRLPPGQYRLKFIVDDSWRCSKQISTATDDDGTLVNWLEVEAPKTEEELKAEWQVDAKAHPAQNEEDEGQWTTVIPAQLAAYQYIEELPSLLAPAALNAHLERFPFLSPVPQPPMLPRILDKVILNTEPKKTWDEPVNGNTPAGLDDNSILAVPNHVVLNHLTASAIKNGTLGVGTTTRYRKKYITTMFFKPTLNDLRDSGEAPPVTTAVPEAAQ